MGRTRHSAWACDRACTPVPSSASTAASSRASSRADRAEQAPVRAAVMAVPSSNAAGSPVSGSNATMSAWCVGSRARSLCGKSDTSLVMSTPADGRKPGIAARNPSCSDTRAATRSGTEARPALRSAIAGARASISESTSSRDSTCDWSRTSMRLNLQIEHPVGDRRATESTATSSPWL